MAGGSKDVVETALTSQRAKYEVLRCTEIPISVALVHQRNLGQDLCDTEGLGTWYLIFPMDRLRRNDFIRPL